MIHQIEGYFRCLDNSARRELRNILLIEKLIN